MSRLPLSSGAAVLVAGALHAPGHADGGIVGGDNGGGVRVRREVLVEPLELAGRHGPARLEGHVHHVAPELFAERVQRTVAPLPPRVEQRKMQALVVEGIVDAVAGQAVTEGLEEPRARVLEDKVMVAAHGVIGDAERFHETVRLEHGVARLVAADVARGHNEIGGERGQIATQGGHHLRHHGAQEAVVPFAVTWTGQMRVGQMNKTPHINAPFGLGQDTILGRAAQMAARPPEIIPQSGNIPVIARKAPGWIERKRAGVFRRLGFQPGCLSCVGWASSPAASLA